MQRASTRTLSLALVAAGSLCIAAPAVFYDGPSDESAYRDLIFSSEPVDGPEHMYDPALEGGPTGKLEDTLVENVRPGADESGVPSGGPPSPLFGAGSWEQKLLRMEELAPRPVESADIGQRLPLPADLRTPVAGPELDELLAAPLRPAPTREANDLDLNPWSALIGSYLGREVASPAEGRPPGEGWAHQRWSEFPPAEMIVTAQTGARPNLGARDATQRHGYAHGSGHSEFGPGGLYHRVLDGLQPGTTRDVRVRFHPAMPDQAPNSVWTFDGTLPPKLVQGRHGVPLLLRHYNGLPIDVTASGGFGVHTLTTHHHNGHNPGESDGHPSAYFFPGQFYDYRWPLALAGHDSINTDASDPRAGYPTDDGGRVNIRGDWRETLSSMWFHDHMIDFTAPNVYKGNAAVMNTYSSLDRGNEAIDDGVNLRLPSGTQLGWGNRDYDVNLVLADKAWDDEGQLWYNPYQTDGMLGDRLLTNWQYHPYLDVRARRYRFRILNGAVARYFRIAVVAERAGMNTGEFRGPNGSGVSYDRVPFHMIANDGNLMEYAVPFDGTGGTSRGIMPSMAIGERFDIVVDFSAFEPGTNLYLVNLMEWDDGRKPDDIVPLKRVLRGSYRAIEVDDDGDGLADSYRRGDPCVGAFLQLRVHELPPGVTDLSTNLTQFEPGGTKLMEHNRPTQQELAGARRREFKFGRSGGTDKYPWTVKTEDGAYTAEMRRITYAPQTGDLEVWTIVGKNGWSHPAHTHFEEGFILSKDGETPPIWERFARKDIMRVGPLDDSANEIVVAFRFREFAGTYVEHCHNTTHEDTAMLFRWDLEHPGQLKLMPTPLPQWDGVTYVTSVALDTFRSGDEGGGDGGNGNDGNDGNDGGGGNDGGDGGVDEGEDDDEDDEDDDEDDEDDD